ncbi:transposase [Novosphingobium chloroacetimidivorans]|uniref:Transposase n=1 Tax=Novosphingobium chloroacetimidivorans TaxID=1428314 RepID=A0A7W7KE22_9SPHN|nr:transposase [Novosphingobium chloroacetimidivorans]
MVFLTETGLNTKMARLYGWSPVGERCRDKVPFGHWKTMTFVAGLRLTGVTAPWGARSRDGWRCFPHLTSSTSSRPTLERGDVVVLDNLPAHKVTGIREAIAKLRAQISHLPPYSPDMNPIEIAYAKLNALLRQEPARTVDALVDRIGKLLDRFLPDECANFFHAAGYQRSC